MKKKILSIMLAAMMVSMYTVGSTVTAFADGDTTGGTGEGTPAVVETTSTAVTSANYVALDKDQIDITVGMTSTLKATVLFKADNSELTGYDPSVLTWSSADPAVATVADGVVTAVAAGETNVSVTLDDGTKSGYTYNCLVKVSAPEESKQNEDGTYSLPGYEDVTYTIVDYDSTSHTADINIIIGSGASGNQNIDLSSMAVAVVSKVFSTPGDAVDVKFNITTADGNKHTYQYKDGSLVLGIKQGWSETQKGMLTGIKDSSGNAMPIDVLAAIGRNRAMQYLFKKADASNINATDIVNIYQTLATEESTEGYKRPAFTGENAITDYYLWYCNNFNYSTGAKLATPNNYGSIEEFVSSRPTAMIKLQGTLANYQFNVSEKWLDEHAADDNYKTMMDYAYVTGPNKDGTYSIQFKAPEQAIALATYNEWYKNLFLADYEGATVNDENGNPVSLDFKYFNRYLQKTYGIDNGVGEYTSDSDAYKEANAYFQKLLSEGLSAKSAVGASISLFLGLNGPLIGNQYQCYDFNFNNSITLEQVDGALTINKVDSATKKIITDKQAGFNLYYVTVATDNDSSKTLYYAIDKDGNGYFTDDTTKAAVLMTTEGSLTIQYLLPNVYYIKEVVAPNGYEINKDALTAEVKSGSITTVNFADTATPVEPPYIPPVTPTPDPVTPVVTPDDPDNNNTDNPDTPVVVPDQPDNNNTNTPTTPVVVPDQPENNNVDQPKTGDENSVMPWAIMGLTSAVLAGAVLIQRRKEENN